MSRCPRCERITTAPECCGVIFADRRTWRMTPDLIKHVHVVARSVKGLDEETYRARLHAVGALSSKTLTRSQFNTFMRELAKLPDVPKRRARAVA